MEVNIKFTITDETVSEVIKAVKEFHDIDLTEKQSTSLIVEHLEMVGYKLIYNFNIKDISKLSILTCCGIDLDDYFSKK